ncbi:tRNA threonylcarbamoyladenosine dehydratase [Rubellicoccus peritrichatus]|uniref:tRNA threonylcarbamoyladenosine dehydratase n=1 Tax=Rubellicoccus peritrichatus TaxID=3080537 RepID=A0AAQ3LF38_9BACT|nr:tRNA threonylcarbamoyladenosine dehydratase [Puniceicoccus sp. CR14]WOO42523.1 tRNA threonylcarbamoyladenosine dehydratase [Puniceicoccus sp. CR14]
MDDFQQRFSGLGRLYSTDGLDRLRAAHVCVIGIGGVGVWTAEALARSGVGALTLVDLDDICVTNTNRQLHALDGTFGKLKVEAMAERIQAINPACKVDARAEFFTEKNAHDFLAQDFDCIVDAIDSVKNKCLLISECRQQKMPLVSTAGAGGRRDPTTVRVVDLTRVFNDPLSALVRKKLRYEFGFPKDLNEDFGIPCVFSTERPIYPRDDGSVSTERESGADYRLNCDYGFGTAAFITGAYGFAAAAEVVRLITNGFQNSP